MGKTRYQKSIELIKKLKEQYPDNLIHFKELIIAIEKYIGSDKERTTKPTLKLMIDTGLIKQLDKEGIKFELCAVN